MGTNSNKRPKYSFVIPAYNAGAIISRAVSSIAAGMDDCEIIVAENGSTDNTSAVVSGLMERDKRIRLIHTDKGVSRARNGGVREAAGEWLLFADADDLWIADEAALDALTEKLRDADVIACSYQKDDRAVVHDYKQMNTVLSNERKKEVFEWMLERPTLRMTVWAKLYKRQVIADNDIAFDENLRLSEDADFLIRLLDRCGSAAVSDVQIYRYCSDAPSVVRSYDKTRIEGYLTALETIAGRVPDDISTFTDFVIAHLNLICVHNIFTADKNLSYAERKKEIKRVLRNPVIAEAVSSAGIGDITDLNKVPAVFFRHGMYFAGGLVCKTKALMNKRNRQHSNRSGKRI